MDESVWIKGYYLDASALVKLVIYEPDSEAIRELGTHSFFATPMCLAEAFGVVKREQKKRQYYRAVQQLLLYVSSEKIRIDDLGSFKYPLHERVRGLAE